MVALRISLLGRPQILQFEKPVTQCLSPKALGLLAYLIMGSSRGHTREKLAGLFWGESDEEHASFYLRRTLWSLRKAINIPGAPPDAYIRYEDGRYSFNQLSSHWLDINDFDCAIEAHSRHRIRPPSCSSADRQNTVSHGLESLRDTLQLYRGDFLEGCSPRGCAAFVDWLLLERDRLEQQYIKGLRVLAAESAVRGEYQQAISDCYRILAVDALNEAAHCDLMAAYHALGRRDKAVEQYRSFCRVLHQQLDLEPLPETQKLYFDIRDGSLMVGGPSYWLASAYDTAAQLIPPEPFVGREAELHKVRAALESAMQGGGCLAVISGEAGVGKTRLIEEFLHQMSGFRLTILRACCFAQEQGLPYQPVIDALRAYLARADVTYLKSLDDLWLAEVARLLPELHTCLPCLPVSPPLVPEQGRNRLFEGLAQFVIHLSRREPVILFLDDFHAADEPTFALIHYLARRLASSCVLILCALRKEAFADRPDLADLLGELDRAGRLVTIPLACLSKLEVLELIRRSIGILGDLEALGHRLYLDSGGNSFFLVEMLKARQEWQGAALEATPVPPNVRDVIQHRLHRLDEASRRVLMMAAVIGRQFASAILQQVYAGEEQHLLYLLDGLVSRGWIVELPGTSLGTYQFSHGLVQEAIYQTLRPDWRLRLHHRVGLAFEAAAGERDELAGVLAHHFGEAGDAKTALFWSLRAAAYAQKLYGNHEAAAHYRRALEIAGETTSSLSESESLEIQYQLGKAHEFLGEYDTAIAVYKAALPVCDLTRSSHRRIWFQLATAYDRKGEYDQALDHLRAIGTHLLEPKDQVARLEAATVGRGMAMVYLHREQGHHALAYCRQALALVQDAADKEGQASAAPEAVAEKVAIYEIMADSYFHLGDYHAAVDHFKQALGIAHSYDWKPTISRLLLGLGKIFRRRGAYDQAEIYAQQSLDICHDIGHIAGQAASVGALGDVAYNRGEFEQAISYYQQALATFRHIGDQHGIADYSLSVAFVKIDQGEIDEAEKHLLEALSIGESINAALVLIRGQYHLVRVARARGHLDEAQASAEQVIQAAQQAGIRLLEAMGYRLWGEILAQNRMPAQAEDCMLRSIRLLEGLGDPYETACALRSHARFLASRGDVSHARAQLERAAAVFAELGAQRELAKTTAELAHLCSSQK